MDQEARNGKVVIVPPLSALGARRASAEARGSATRIFRETRKHASAARVAVGPDLVHQRRQPVFEAVQSAVGTVVFFRKSGVMNGTRSSRGDCPTVTIPMRSIVASSRLRRA